MGCARISAHIQPRWHGYTQNNEPHMIAEFTLMAQTYYRKIWRKSRLSGMQRKKKPEKPPRSRHVSLKFD